MSEKRSIPMMEFFNKKVVGISDVKKTSYTYFRTKMSKSIIGKKKLVTLTLIYLRRDYIHH